MPETHLLRVIDETKVHEWAVPHGSNLRQVLLGRGLSPYTRITRHLNCGGRGLCATCGVYLHPPAPAPVHWHDRAAAHWHYPRLSCQVVVTQPLTVELVADKVVWGKRRAL